MTLDPQSAWVLDLVEKADYPLLETLDAKEARAQYEETAWRLDAEPAPMANVADLSVPVEGGSIRVRAYTPEGVPADGAPALVYYHGGGWVIGSLETHDRLCRKLAELTECKVIAVDYRLAPEHPFPVGVEDSLAAFRWIVAKSGDLGVDPSRLAVGGDSAGGNISAVLCQQLRDAGDAHAPCFQLLIYPATDHTRDYPSRQANADGYLLTLSLMDWFSGHYLKSGPDFADPRLSPIEAKSLAGLPPAFVMTAEYDPLRDEGAAYAKALEAAGVPTRYQDYPGMLHGFINMSGAVDVAKAAVKDAAGALKEVFG